MKQTYDKNYVSSRDTYLKEWNQSEPQSAKTIAADKSSIINSQDLELGDTHYRTVEEFLAKKPTPRAVEVEL